MLLLLARWSSWLQFHLSPLSLSLSAFYSSLILLSLWQPRRRVKQLPCGSRRSLDLLSDVAGNFHDVVRLLGWSHLAGGDSFRYIVGHLHKMYPS